MSIPIWLRPVLYAISVITIASGAGQLVMPGFVLRIIGADVTPTSSHFFAIIGMFMVLFGAAMLGALRASSDQAVAVFWSAMQKFGAAAAVGLGVGRDIFSSVALLVAGFDLLSGFLIIWYWLSLRRPG
jgi:hypothetical protein